MTPPELAGLRVRRLLAELGADRDAFTALQDELDALAVSVDPHARVLAQAFTLDRSYSALESILERIARTLEGELPLGSDWHARLVRNAGLAIEGVRPAVLSDASTAAADSLRRFRHFSRHAYGARIDPVRIAALVVESAQLRRSVSDDLDRFEAFLRSLLV